MEIGEVKIGEKMLYAIIENGGKQYKAVEGGYLEIDLLPDEVGKKKTFHKVLMLVNGEKTEIGSPYIKDVSVEATIVDHFKGPKITVFKYRPKQRYRVKTGHRQKFSKIMVDSIAFTGKKVSAVSETSTDKSKVTDKTTTDSKTGKSIAAAKQSQSSKKKLENTVKVKNKTEKKEEKRKAPSTKK